MKLISNIQCSIQEFSRFSDKDILLTIDKKVGWVSIDPAVVSVEKIFEPQIKINR